VSSLFKSFFLGGFECSAHRRADGVRLDMLASSGHEAHAHADYAQLDACGVQAVRDGVRWHRIERGHGDYDWDSFIPMLEAARRTGTQVIWDLCHYGWPDDLDFFSGAFVERFASFAASLATLVRDESEDVPFYCPINEISFWAWAGGEVARMNPCARGSGARVKQQLVRASIAAIHAVRSVDPRARFVVAEPLINVVSGSEQWADRLAAHNHHMSQFEVHDMLTGALHPELGGDPHCLDIVGVNFYADNQWYLHGSTIPLGHHSYRPLSEMLQEVHERYRRPLMIAETGAEGGAKSYWLHHVCGEVRAARRSGVPVEGICLYPITDYHGWDNGRVCNVGLLSMPDAEGRRRVCPSLEEELRAQQAVFAHAWPEPQISGPQVRYG
jgi:beta-glucosidase/6-phospho-beta-glucosidase/beta-galactosidase